MIDTDLVTLYPLGKGLDAASPGQNPAYRALLKTIQSGEKGMRLKCPHCGSSARIRTSTAYSKLTRIAFCQCDNVACGHTFKAAFEIISTISPSAFPDPLVAAQLKRSKGAETRDVSALAGEFEAAT